MKVIKRRLQPLILKALESFPAVYINGPRQAGKTTLVRELLAKDFKSKFITFDDILERAAAKRNPLGYMRESGTPLIIDEVQMASDVFRPLKMLIDEQRQEALGSNGSANGNYLLTGSANLMVIPELANAMVGRMATLTLLPLSASEIKNTTSHFLERCFVKDFSEIKTDKTPLTEIMRKASYPELMQMSEVMVDMWFKNYIQKITLEDPRHIYNLEKAEFMPVLLQSLAARAGNLINDASIGREVGLNAVTTRNYRGLLNGTFVTNTLNPWYRNITKRLVKSDKMFFHDTMLLCHLLGSTPENLVKSNPTRFGHVLENFVLSELCKTNFSTGEKVDISFYRTNDGREVDFILEKQHKLVAIEVKHAESISDKDLAGIKELQANTGDDFHCGIVLCNTPRVIAYDKDIYLLPFSSLWQ
ncbi:MAG: ATP-binding protein [Verrucomicrobiales bacterium]|nr:ATP-binding protein [Verrucomicrobiales bacterium]